MIAFLIKSDADEGFDQIVDFLNAHMIHMVRNMDSPSKFLMRPRFLQLMINAQVGDLSSHNTKYTSPVLTQKIFANIRRIGKGFLGVDTLLFDGMLVQQQVQAVKDAIEDEDDDNEVYAKPTSPSPTPATPPSSPTQKHIPSPPQAETAQPSSPPQQQPSQHTDILMTLFNKLIETCATLTKQVANWEQDKIAQAIEITKLKQRVRRGEPVEVEKVIKVVTAAKLMIEVVTTTATTITVAHLPKASTPGEGRDEAFARQLEAELNANINWGDVMEQVKRKEKKDNTVMRYQALKRKLVTEAQARKNMMIYLKNMARFKMDFFKDDFLLNNFKIMYEKPNVEARIWRDQKGRYGLSKVKSGKLFEFCRVYIITLITT
nr:hypothetical protein [Tanacetum cinerariifolium]